MRKGIKALVVISSAFGCLWVQHPVSVIADSAVALIADSTVDWKDTDAGHTVEVTLTNLTNAALPLTATPDANGSPAGESETTDVPTATCELKSEPETLAATGEPTKVKITIPVACDTHGGKFALTLSAGGTPFKITVSEPETPNPWWWILLVFPSVLVVGAILLGLFKGQESKLEDPLDHLDAEWSFKDSYVTNVTVLGAILTGVVGSASVVKAIIGEDSDSAVALATVGAAIGAAMAAAGPVVLAATRTKAKNSYTRFGVYVGALLVFSGAVGELVVVAWTGAVLDVTPDLVEWFIWAVAAVAVVLLLVYSLRVTAQIVSEGTNPGDPAEPDPEILAVAVSLWIDQHPHEQLTAEVVSQLKSNLTAAKEKAVELSPMGAPAEAAAGRLSRRRRSGTFGF